MIKPAPPIDKRTAADIAKQMRDLLKVYVPEWQEKKSDRISIALINIFARFAEIIIRRLNRVPDKNFLAFLDLLGASRLPPQPARVPLTFTLAEGTIVDAVVPAGTQVAAPPAEGESDPVIFETERELVVTAAQLTRIFVRDPEQDTYSDRTSLIQTSSSGVPVWRGDRAIEHILYIGHHQLLAFPEIASLSLTFNLDPALGDGGRIEWQVWNGKNWERLSPAANSTQNLSQRGSNQVNFGRITAVPISLLRAGFVVNSSVVTTELSAKPAPTENRWLRCRLLTPLTQAETLQAGMVRTNQLPKISNIAITADVNRQNLLIEAAFTNQIPVDLSKDFFPFGERPKFGDTLYLANREAFSQPDATVRLAIYISNPVTTAFASAIDPRTKPSSNLNLKWEYWNGRTWEALGVTSPTGVVQPPGQFEFRDTTKALSDRVANDTPGEVSFKVPKTIAPTTINGIENYWIRARITVGNYGQEARYELVIGSNGQPQIINGEQAYKRVGDSFSPPLIKSVAVSYNKLVQQEKPQVVLTYNNFVYTDESQSTTFSPFQSNQDNNPTLYFGFTLPPDRNLFPNRPISLFSRIADIEYQEKLVPLSPNRSQEFGRSGSPEHEFSVTNSTSEVVNWQIKLLGTRWPTELTTPATIRLNAKAEELVRVRVTIPEDESLGSRDRGFLQLTNLNDPSTIYSATFETVVASEPPIDENPRLIWEYFNGQNWQQLLVRDETAAFARPGLVEFLPPADFSQTTVFGLAPQYWLRARWERGNYAVEPRLQRVLINTTMAAQTVTFRDEILGSSDGTANQIFRTIHAPVLINQELDVAEELFSGSEIDAIATATASWIRWQEVPDFYGSGSRDRHYVLNRLTGEIRFGDGRNGLIPPIGAGNIRMTHYRTGGGSTGNRPAGVVVQLTTTVPYVDAVTNTEASAGGAEAEDLDVLRDRIPRQIRHRDRAVTVEDYEDLAKQASSEVARAKCVPLYDLSVNQTIDLDDTERRTPGTLSLIIIPRLPSPNPSPSLELIGRVQDYLDRRRLPTARLVVVGPRYVPVDVEAEIALTALEKANTVESAVLQTLARFLHPLTGGLDGTGWEFGRQPHKSDLYALLEAIPGVEYIRTLKVPEIEAGDLFLVYSGTHKISLTV